MRRNVLVFYRILKDLKSKPSKNHSTYYELKLKLTNNFQFMILPNELENFQSLKVLEVCAITGKERHLQRTCIRPHFIFIQFIISLECVCSIHHSKDVKIGVNCSQTPVVYGFCKRKCTSCTLH